MGNPDCNQEGTMSEQSTNPICATCGATITAHDTSPCDTSECPIPMPARTANPLLRGEFVRINVADPSPMTVSDNPLARHHAALVGELARFVVPRIHVNPLPEEFEDVADYLLRVSRACDRWLKSIGEEINRNATISIDMDVFTEQFVAAVDGNATFQCDRAAEELREEQSEIASERRGYADEIGEHLIRAHRSLFGS